MTLVIVVIFLSLWTHAIRRAQEYDGLLSPIVILGFSVFFYAFAIPVELYLRVDKTVGFTGIRMSDHIGLTITILATLGYASLTATYLWIASMGRRIGDLDWSDGGGRLASRSVGLLTILAITALVLSFPDNIMAARDYAANIQQTSATSGASGYFLLNRASCELYGMYAFIAIIRTNEKTVKALFRCLPLVVWSIYSNDKDPMVLAMLAFTATYLHRVSKKALNPLIAILAATATLLATTLGTIAFGLVRAGTDLSHIREDIAAKGIFIAIDPAGPAFVNTSALRSTATPLFGSTILHGLFLWLPRFVWPSRPTDFGQTFAQEYYSNWHPGFGYGFSPIAEGWYNFRTLGVILVFALIGTLLGLARNVILQVTRRPIGWAFTGSAAVVVLLGYVSFTSMRGTLANLVTALLQNLMLLTIIGVTQQFFLMKRRRNADSSSSNDNDGRRRPERGSASKRRTRSTRT